MLTEDAESVGRLIKEWADDSPTLGKRAWFHGQYGKVYCRVTLRGGTPVLTVASIEAYKRGRGWWTALASQLPYCVVENVLTERFQRWFQRNGWHCLRSEDGVKSYGKVTGAIVRLAGDETVSRRGTPVAHGD